MAGRQHSHYMDAHSDGFQNSDCKNTKYFNTLRLRQNGRHFPDYIFKCIFLNENVWISIKVSLTLVPKGPINNIHALVQIMAWRRSGDKPLSEAVMVSLLTHKCVTRPQWVNPLWPNNAIGNHGSSPGILVNIGSGNGLVPAWHQTITCSISSHYLNQCCLMGNLTLRNKLQWNFDTSIIFWSQQNALEKVIHIVFGHNVLWFYYQLQG